MKAKIWVLKERIVGKPRLDHFSCLEESLPDCKDGEFIIEAESLSVDPYMRYRMEQIVLNKDVIPGSQIAKVVESKNSDYPVGTFVLIYSGWRSHTLITPEQLKSFGKGSFMKIPDLGNLHRSLCLGVIGMPGLTAYFGLYDVGLAKENDTVLVNGAAGAVGSVVVQLAKIKGCKVIAFAGTDEKVSWVKELGADYVFNYKTTNISEVLKEVAPKGINCYFDNVGGDFTVQVMPHMAEFSRIAICGSISTYNEKDAWKLKAVQGPYNPLTLLWKQIRVEGFIVSRFFGKYFEAMNQLKKHIDEGNLKYRETIVRGFGNMPSAFLGLFEGENIGKAVVYA